MINNKIIDMLLLAAGLLLGIAGCGANHAAPDISETSVSIGSAQQTEESDENEMVLTVNQSKIPVTWEENPTVSQLGEQVASGEITIQMSMYGDFEQVGSLGKEYVRNDRQMDTRSGDIVLYNGSNLVVFYGDHSWAYTKLGHIELPADEITELFSEQAVTIQLTMDH